MVSGSARARGVAEEDTLTDPYSDAKESPRHARSYEKIINLRGQKAVWITRLTDVVLFLTSVRLWLWYESTNGLILAPEIFPQITVVPEFPTR